MKGKVLIFLFLLLGILGLVGYWKWEKNSYSKDVLKLEILGPERVNAFGEVEYLVRYKNNGNIRLEEPRLIFEYPEYSIVEGNKPLRQELDSEELGGAIYPGEEKVISFKARLLGAEGEIKIAKATLVYRPKNLKAYYKSTTSFTTIINSVPLNLDFDLPSKIASGKEFRFVLNYFSNIDYPLSGLRVKMEYPTDFEFIDSSPKSLEKTDWDLPLLNKAEGGRIEIKGKLRGKITEEKIFRAKLGMWQNGNFVLLKTISKGVEIVKPSLYITQQINGNPKYIASPGDLLHYEIFFKNIGEEPLIDLTLVTTLDGDAFDFSTLKAPNGEYEKGDNSIIWDWRRVRALQFLDAQEEGRVEFWIKLKKDWEIHSAKGKEIIKNRIYLSQAKEEFINKINSRLAITQRGYFEDDIFDNSGPIPPRTGATTTYTITWQAKNYYNEVKNVKVKSILPKNVKLTGEIFPEEERENFTFDSKSREIVWNVGDLKVGEGILSPGPNISFQIAFSPTSSQKNEKEKLIGKTKIEGEDVWTKEIITATADSIDTTLSNNNPQENEEE